MPNRPGKNDSVVTGFHLHRWSEWQDAEGTYDSPLFPKLGTWKAPVQIRRCLKCRKSQVRKVG